MNSQEPSDIPMTAEAYDRKAEEYNWRGPEVAFGLSYSFIKPGESVLDIGIGTGLSSALFHKSGLRVFGMDKSVEMLEACRQKGFAADLKKHDLTIEPYPYETASLNHAICIGVLDFFRDLKPVFREVARILRDNGLFVFAVAERCPGEGPEYTAESQPGLTVTMYRRTTEEINCLLQDNDFESLRYVGFSMFMNPERTTTLPLKAYLARRIRRI
jgi:ubiquinone/menaquinone biosynthesis C-methylase UbiE